MSWFFSSRRRHTRCLSDWSSDVCSSDLGAMFNDNFRVGRRWERNLAGGFPEHLGSLRARSLVQWALLSPPTRHGKPHQGFVALRPRWTHWAASVGDRPGLNREPKTLDPSLHSRQCYFRECKEGSRVF